MKKGKKYLEAAKLVDKSKLYTKEEAIKLVKETSVANFDASVELAMRLNLDTKKAETAIKQALIIYKIATITAKIFMFSRSFVIFLFLF